jgi:alkanesulfonate monooxygenase SsuD/methylene tetrahydromethanopterin reductase-like flavin-dependent oxidoreductase (luciferase family)
VRVGVCLPISERGAERRIHPFAEMREMAVVAEQGGLDSVWVADHLLFHAPDGQVRGAWESMSILGALANATERVELGPLVLCTPLRNPGLMAWAANTLDEISGGRFVLGLGAGWNEPEFRAFGFEFDRKVTLFEESLSVIAPLLRDGRVDFVGRLTRGKAELRPPGPRRTGPPIVVASTGPRMMLLAARWADRWNSVWYGLPNDRFRDERRGLEAACAESGRDPTTIEVSAGIVIRDSHAAGRDWPEGIDGSVDQIA